VPFEDFERSQRIKEGIVANATNLLRAGRFRAFEELFCVPGRSIRLDGSKGEIAGGRRTICATVRSAGEAVQGLYRNAAVELTDLILRDEGTGVWLRCGQRGQGGRHNALGILRELHGRRSRRRVVQGGIGERDVEDGFSRQHGDAAPKHIGVEVPSNARAVESSITNATDGAGIRRLGLQELIIPARILARAYLHKNLAFICCVLVGTLRQCLSRAPGDLRIQYLAGLSIRNERTWINTDLRGGRCCDLSRQQAAGTT